MADEVCENCGEKIGRLQTACVHAGHVVCKTCDTKLRSDSINIASMKKNSSLWPICFLFVIIVGGFLLFNYSKLNSKKQVFTEDQKNLIRNVIKEASLLNGVLFDCMQSESQEKKLHAALELLDELKNVNDKSVNDIQITMLQTTGYSLCTIAGTFRIQLELNQKDQWDATLKDFHKTHEQLHQDCLKFLSY